MYNGLILRSRTTGPDSAVLGRVFSLFEILHQFLSLAIAGCAKGDLKSLHPQKQMMINKLKKKQKKF